MARPVVFLDACVLYPGLTRGIVLRLAEAGLFLPAWTPRVLMEWRIASARNGDAGATVDAITARMAKTFPAASVSSDPAVEQTLRLPDPADTHVLAGAIAAGAGVLLTFNMRDFPARRLRRSRQPAGRHPERHIEPVISTNRLLTRVHLNTGTGQ
jgi:hypothetical protein